MSLIETDIFGEVEDLVKNSIELIQKYEPVEGYYVCFSGGKDSIVMYDLVKKSGVKYDVHMNLTSVDPPELLAFIRKEYPEVKLHRPAMSMFQLIIKNGIPPLGNLRYCCRILKEHGGSDRTKITGIRKEESTGRSKRIAFEKNTFGEGYILNPILEWASDEIWDYIHTHNLPYPSLYDEGFHRIGCIGCPQGNKAQRNQQFSRWPQFKKAYYNTFAKLIEQRKQQNKPDTKGNYKDAETLWKWWMEELPKEDKNQTKIEFMRKEKGE